MIISYVGDARTNSGVFSMGRAIFNHLCQKSRVIFFAGNYESAALALLDKGIEVIPIPCFRYLGRLGWIGRFLIVKIIVRRLNREDSGILMTDGRTIVSCLGLLREHLKPAIRLIARSGTVLSKSGGREPWQTRVEWLKMADCVIVPSQLCANDLIEICGLPAERVRVIPNGIDRADVLRRSAEATIDHGGRRILLFVGSLEERKDPWTALQAFAKISEDHPDFDLWFIGEGPLRTKLATEIKERNLDARVRLLGLVGNPFPYYRAAWGLVSCARMDGFGLTPIEAAVFSLRLFCAEGAVGVSEYLKKFSAADFFPAGGYTELAVLLSGQLSNPGAIESPEDLLTFLSMEKCAERYQQVFLEVGRPS